MTTKRIITISAILITASIITYFATQKKIAVPFVKKKFTEENEIDNTNIVSQPSQSEYPLRIGSRGENVLYLQRFINLLSKSNPNLVSPISDDGVLGGETKRALDTLLITLPITKEQMEKTYRTSSLTVKWQYLKS